MSKGKEHIGLLAKTMSEKGISQVVVSPGSRNAPAIILFSGNSQLNLTSIADERSAGFFALGIAIRTRRPVALLCTSGTAVLNYAPAIAEAYYQKVPLLVITADRPVEWIDQGDGQTIRQEKVFSNFVRKSFSLSPDTHSPDAQWLNERIINEAIERCLRPAPGPVHINLPIAEPLYDLDVEAAYPEARIIRMAETEQVISANTLESVSTVWNNSPAKLILIGQLRNSEQTAQCLKAFADDPSVIILTETTSNVHHHDYIGCIDRVIDGMGEQMAGPFKPGILVTFDGAVISKKIKALLRKMKPSIHWHVGDDPDDFFTDTYQSLTMTFPVPPEVFLSQLGAVAKPVSSSYKNNWLELNHRRRQKHDEYLKSVDFSDLRVYELLFRSIPDNVSIHLANSTPVRYAQLFDQRAGLSFFSNRGTSGIDGCISTAAGFAHASDKPVTVITGDIGFFYDSNALWNNHLNRNFRIILINNGGGNIFRILDGPSAYRQLETYIETAHRLTAENLAINFGLRYFKSVDLPSLENQLPGFFDFSQPSPAIFEVITPNIISAKALKDYFKFLNE